MRFAREPLLRLRNVGFRGFRIACALGARASRPQRRACGRLCQNQDFSGFAGFSGFHFAQLAVFAITLESV